MQVQVLNIKGENTGRTVELPDDIFGVEPNDHVIYLAVKQYQAAHHQGTHKVKTRAEVKGASRKLHRQKGTGGSRKGNIRNPLYKGGGTIFGPKPHWLRFQAEQESKRTRKAECAFLQSKRQRHFCVEDTQLDAPKTKEVMNTIKLEYC
jgi:large subunit ribosomal protein L4